MNSKSIGSLMEFLEHIEQLGDSTGQAHWYRGCSKASYPLKPSLYRHPTTTASAGLLKLESSLLEWLDQRGVPFQDRDLSGLWEKLFFMQHVRIPTRLLDWTENALIGLYFALTGSARKCHEEGGTPKEAAAVWALNPGSWNQGALHDVSYPAKVPGPNDEHLDSHRPGSPEEKMKMLPVAMYGIHNTPRIVAQRGTFVIFGKDTRPMEVIYAGGGFSNAALSKVEIPPDRIGPVLSSLTRLGITASVVFPDIEGFAMETRRHFGFRG